ncbi:hypothetical protein Acr_00g0054500 [Actinidia rufa]|uniref:MBD domain-containing protein n=1 Tax=Actinidia rufa TaxID=165716 RepID=A0A7J0DLT1_9ERIC|nr:hypothetical protein Acr_00g0054500 [Actinidia rufa]
MYIKADPELEALQAELQRRKLGSADDQSNNNPDEAQSALSALPESNPAEGTSGIPPPVDQPPTETAPAQRKRRGRPPKTDPVANPNEVERPSWLPLGWFVVRRTRQNGRSAGHKDKYYIESSTRHPCRSKREVFDYIASKQGGQANTRDSSEGGHAHTEQG